MKTLFLGLVAVLLTTGCAGEFDFDAITGKNNKEEQTVETAAGSRSSGISKNVADRITRNYFNSILFRGANSRELNYWSKLLQSGRLNKSELAAAFYDSQEAYVIRLWIEVGVRRMAAQLQRVPEDYSEMTRSDYNKFYVGPRVRNSPAQASVRKLTAANKRMIISLLNSRRSMHAIKTLIHDRQFPDERR